MKYSHYLSYFLIGFGVRGLIDNTVKNKPCENKEVSE